MGGEVQTCQQPPATKARVNTQSLNLEGSAWWSLSKNIYQFMKKTYILLICMYLIYLVLALGIWPWPYPAIMHLAEDALRMAILQGKLSETKRVMQRSQHREKLLEKTNGYFRKLIIIPHHSTRLGFYSIQIPVSINQISTPNRPPANPRVTLKVVAPLRDPTEERCRGTSGSFLLGPQWILIERSTL